LPSWKRTLTAPERGSAGVRGPGGLLPGSRSAQAAWPSGSSSSPSKGCSTDCAERTLGFWGSAGCRNPNFRNYQLPPGPEQLPWRDRAPTRVGQAPSEPDAPSPLPGSSGLTPRTSKPGPGHGKHRNRDSSLQVERDAKDCPDGCTPRAEPNQAPAPNQPFTSSCSADSESL